MNPKEKVVKYVEDAHAMEQKVLRMLDSTIRTTKDPGIKAELEHHRTQTEEHERRLKERLARLGGGSSPLDQMPGDNPERNGRRGYVTEHLEIAAHELLTSGVDRDDHRGFQRLLREFDEEVAEAHLLRLVAGRLEVSSQAELPGLPGLVSRVRWAQRRARARADGLAARLRRRIGIETQEMEP